MGLKSKTLLIYLFLLISITAKSQDVKYLDSLAKTCQACLDKGVAMLHCENIYYESVDVALNKVYQRIFGKLDSPNKIQFRNEQRIWLHKRDEYFSEVDKEFPSDGNYIDEDTRMMRLDKKATFVDARIRELLKREGR